MTLAAHCHVLLTTTSIRKKHTLRPGYFTYWSCMSKLSDEGNWKSLQLPTQRQSRTLGKKIFILPALSVHVWVPASGITKRKLSTSSWIKNGFLSLLLLQGGSLASQLAPSARVDGEQKGGGAVPRRQPAGRGKAQREVGKRQVSAAIHWHQCDSFSSPGTGRRGTRPQDTLLSI